MIVYRITTEPWSKKLVATGFPSRWCAKGRFMIYTAESRSLACLENLVHRSGEGLNSIYKVMLIEIPEKIAIEKIELTDLKRNWYTVDSYPYCQLIGSKWLDEGKSAILKVPSVVIKKEFNYLLNPAHADFKKIKLKTTEDFDFDERF